jgi:hypothetical protein
MNAEEKIAVDLALVILIIVLVWPRSRSSHFVLAGAFLRPMERDGRIGCHRSLWWSL